MPGLINSTTGLAFGTGLIWLRGGLGGPGEDVLAGFAILDRSETDILDRNGDPVLARVDTPTHSLTVFDRSGADVLDRAAADIQTRV